MTGDGCTCSVDTMTKGTYGQPTNGKHSVIVGFRKTTKGEITDEPTPQSKYVVFVEQSGSYRIGTTRLNNWRSA